MMQPVSVREIIEQLKDMGYHVSITGYTGGEPNFHVTRNRSMRIIGKNVQSDDKGKDNWNSTFDRNR